MKKFKPPSSPPSQRAALKSMMDASLFSPSAKSLGRMMRGYTPQGDKPSTGTRAAPRAHLVRQSSSSYNDIDSTLDRMIAKALTGGPQTTGVLSSLFGLTPNLTGR
jgi:hypothetical protein